MAGLEKVDGNTHMTRFFKHIYELLFGTDSLLKQAHGQFFLALCLFPLIFLPTRLLIQLTYILSVWAIIVSSQTFIAAAKANKKAETIEADTIETDELKVNGE